MKERLDILLVNKGLAPSREKAKAMIMEGNVFVDHNREDKAGSMFDENADIEVKSLKSIAEPRFPLFLSHFCIRFVFHNLITPYRCIRLSLDLFNSSNLEQRTN